MRLDELAKETGIDRAGPISVLVHSHFKRSGKLRRASKGGYISQGPPENKTNKV